MCTIQGDIYITEIQPPPRDVSIHQRAFHGRSFNMPRLQPYIIHGLAAPIYITPPPSNTTFYSYHPPPPPPDPIPIPASLHTDYLLRNTQWYWRWNIHIYKSIKHCASKSVYLIVGRIVLGKLVVCWFYSYLCVRKCHSGHYRGLLLLTLLSDNQIEILSEW